MAQPMDIKTLVEELKRQGRALMLPDMTDRSKLALDEQGLTKLLEMAYCRQVAKRRIKYVPNDLTSGAIKQLAPLPYGQSRQPLYDCAGRQYCHGQDHADAGHETDFVVAGRAQAGIG